MEFTTLSLINILSYAVKDILMCSAYILFSVYIFGGKFKRKYITISLLTISVLATAICGEIYLRPLGYDGIGLLETISSIIYIITVFLLTTGIKKSRLFFLTILFGSVLDLFYSYISPLLADGFLIKNITYIIIYTAIIVAMYCFIKSSAIKVLPEVIATVPKWITAFLILFIFVYFYQQSGPDETAAKFLEPFSVFSIIVCASYFIYKIFHLTYQQNEILKQMHEQKEFSEKMLTGDENLRKFRHDYRNHMIVINALMESGRTDRAREYLNAMNSDIDSTINKISTGNFITDAIINNKAIVAAKENAKIKFSGQIPENGIADDDLCTIIANIVDNAIEAVTKLESDKTVRIEAAMRNGIFLLNVSNSVIADIKIRKDGTIKTTKKNHHEHGIGMKNVQKVVKKYGGTIDVSCENKLFNVAIMMKPTL